MIRWSLPFGAFVLAIAATDGADPGGSVSPPSRVLVSSPDLPECTVAPNAAPLRPGMPSDPGGSADRVWGPEVCHRTLSTTPRETTRADVLIFEKYRTFRESLTAP